MQKEAPEAVAATASLLLFEVEQKEDERFCQVSGGPAHDVKTNALKELYPSLMLFLSLSSPYRW